MIEFNFYDCPNCLTVFAAPSDLVEVHCVNPNCGGNMQRVHAIGRKSIDILDGEFQEG